MTSQYDSNQLVINEKSDADQTGSPKGYATISGTTMSFINGDLFVFSPNTTHLKQIGKGRPQDTFPKITGSNPIQSGVDFDDGWTGFNVFINQDDQVIITCYGSGRPITGFYRGHLITLEHQ
jgi:hypothetical protein